MKDLPQSPLETEIARLSRLECLRRRLVLREAMRRRLADLATARGLRLSGRPGGGWRLLGTEGRVDGEWIGPETDGSPADLAAMALASPVPANLLVEDGTVAGLLSGARVVARATLADAAGLSALLGAFVDAAAGAHHGAVPAGPAPPAPSDRDRLLARLAARLGDLSDEDLAMAGRYLRAFIEG